jgi:hypothetical protein
MSEWKMIQQIPESKNLEFFFKQVSPERAYSLEVFNRTG